MKRTICLLLAAWLLLSVSPALAGPYVSLPELRGQAEKGWHQTYQAHGRSITVDIPIDVPEGEHFPAFRAAPQPLSALVPETQPSEDFGHFDGTYTYRHYPGLLQIVVGNAKEQHQTAIRKSKNRPRAGFDGHSIYPPDVDWEKAYAYKNEATVRGLYDKAMALWQRHFPGQPLALRLTEVWAGTAYRQIDESIPDFVGPPIETEFNAFLAPKFEQLAAGIPLLAYADSSFLIFGGYVKGYRPKPTGNAAPGMQVYSRSMLEEYGMEGLQEWVDFGTLQIGDKLAEDLPLCAVPQAIAAYEQLILSGQLRHVHKLRLGYAIWEDKDKPDHYLLLPAWVAWGVLVKKPGKAAWFDSRFPSLAQSRFWESNEYGPILVNAQTGQLIDPWRTDADSAKDAPELVRWE